MSAAPERANTSFNPIHTLVVPARERFRVEAEVCRRQASKAVKSEDKEALAAARCRLAQLAEEAYRRRDQFD